MDNSPEQEKEIETRVGFLDVMKSTMAAFIGVQSNANRERDFKHGRISHFIATGLLLGLLFVLTLVGIVQLVMHFVGN